MAGPVEGLVGKHHLLNRSANLIKKPFSIVLMIYKNVESQ